MSDLDRALMLCEARRYEDALSFAHRAIASDPADANAICVLASTLYHLGRFSDSLKAAEQAVVQDPDWEWPHRMRALALLRLGKKRPALAAAREATRLGPRVPEAHFVAVQAELVNGRLSDASSSAQRCIALDPDAAIGHNAVAHVMLESKKWEQAEQACRRALAIDPEDSAARHNLGIAVSKQKGRAIEGIGHFAAASKLDPRDMLSREHVVAAGRRYAAGGMLGLYVLYKTFLISLRHPDGSASALVSLVLLFALGGVGGWLLIRRRRRLAQLPHGVAELIRRENRSMGRRTRQFMLGVWVIVALSGVIVLLNGSPVGVLLSAVGVAMALVTLRLAVPRS